MQEKTQRMSYAMLRRRVYGYKEKYPFAGYTVCGRSWSGRAVFTLSLGKRDEPAVYVAGIRGGDSAGVEVLLDFFENLCSCVSVHGKMAGIRLDEVLAEKGVVIIPCVNPDGLEIVSCGAVAAGSYAGLVERVCSGTDSWQANSRGVDIDLNFSTRFLHSKKAAEGCGYTSPGPYFYGGKVPESEPETRALVRLCRARDVRHVADVRSGGGFMYVPEVEIAKDRVEMMSRILSLSSGIPRLNGHPGPLERYGFAEWFCDTYGRPAFVLNAQGSEKEIYSKLEEALVLSLMM